MAFNKFRGQVPQYEAEGVGPDDILEYIKAFSNMKSGSEADERAEKQDARLERMAVLQEANMKWAQSVAEDTKLANDYLSQSIKGGFDWDTLMSENYSDTWSQDLPSPESSYEGYTKKMAGNTGSAMSFPTYLDHWGLGSYKYINMQIGKMNAYRDELVGKGMNDEQINTHLEDMGAEKLKSQATAIYGYQGQPFNASNMMGATLNYQSPAYKDDRGWLAKTFQGQPDVTIGDKTYTAEGTSGITTGQVATAGTVTAAGIYGYGKTVNQIRDAAKEITATALKNAATSTKKAPLMGFKEFMTEYGVTKKALQAMSKEELLQLATKKGWDSTTIAKIVGNFKGMDKAAMARKVAGGLAWAMPEVGKWADEQMGTDDKAQTVGTGAVLYHMIPHKAKAGFFKFLGKRLGGMLGKQAAAAGARHLASAATGVGANPYWQAGMFFAEVAYAGYSVADLIQEYYREG